MTETSDLPSMAGFFSELRRLKLVEGQNVIIDRYAAPSDIAPEVARRMVDSAPDVIVIQGAGDAALAAMALTKTIPIVSGGGDPVAQGIVSNLAHPGGNVTAISLYTGDLSSKVLAILAEAVPNAKRVTYIGVGTGGQSVAIVAYAVNSAMAAASKLGLTMNTVFVPVQTTEQDFRDAVAQAAAAKADMIEFGFNAQNASFSAITARLALEARMPAISPFGAFTDAGGLLSYGANLGDYGRKVAQYAALVLGGAKPGDLSVIEPDVFDFVVNLKTANAIGVTIPASILARATQVIE
jgi:putative ABC transport system substrate-binding protein